MGLGDFINNLTGRKKKPQQPATLMEATQTQTPAQQSLMDLNAKMQGLNSVPLTPEQLAILGAEIKDKKDRLGM